jgi:hypothetical protein
MDEGETMTTTKSDLTLFIGAGLITIIMGTVIGWAAYLSLSLVATVAACAFFRGANRAA